MSYNLFLDDKRYPYTDSNLYIEDAYYYTKNPAYKDLKWVIVRNYDDFVSYITEHGVPKIVSFDHDLADEHYWAYFHKNVNYEIFNEKTGYDCAKWLCEYCQEHKVKFPKYMVHSFNTIGAKNINTYIENYILHVENAY